MAAKSGNKENLENYNKLWYENADIISDGIIKKFSQKFNQHLLSVYNKRLLVLALVAFYCII